MIKVSKNIAGNGHEFCDNPKEIVEEAERLGLSRMDIARIANVDPSTVRNWIRKNEAALKPILRLAAHNNSIKPPTATPIQVVHTPSDMPSVIQSIPLTPMQTGFLGEINAVLASVGKTLAVVDLP